jgi:phage shock protein E
MNQMINAIKSLFGFGTKVDYSALVKQGAIILDVRSKDEYQGGHIKGSINISVNTLSNHLSKLKKDKPIITCCASGMRSAAAKSILKSNGFTEVYNGGGWMSLQNKIK